MLDYQQTQSLIKAVLGFKPQEFIKFMDLQAQMMGKFEQKFLYESRCFGEYFKQIFSVSNYTENLKSLSPLEKSPEIEDTPIFEQQ